MTTIEFDEGAISVDAKLIAEGLAIDPAVVQSKMREGKITSLCERGVGEDAGRYRLTFFHESRRFRVLVDTEGKILERSAADLRSRTPRRSPLRRREPR